MKYNIFTDSIPEGLRDKHRERMKEIEDRELKYGSTSWLKSALREFINWDKYKA